MSNLLNRRNRTLRGLIAAAAVLLASACSADKVTGPSPSPSRNPDELLGLFSKPRLLQCEATETPQQTSALLGIDGGTLSLGGNTVVVPLGALLGPATIELTIPASRYLEVELTAKDNDGNSVVFQQPIVVTIDYSRCSRSDVFWKLLSVWYINSDTKELLENMGGLDNKLLEKITFITPHFSGFAIAY